ncbi:hypothetical protein K6R05_21655 (plasmid) [Pantoea alfalfae]|uniref:hypothetical protein n=1 Tax=Pantoea alfalfae TaxID=3074822 RepID=UPI001CA3A3E8|nr:hypothetical protein [Pantoea alfalfae]QZX98173.1 hypothetical protein K6R05_21655 [Pantoea alfalfae]
MKHTPQRNAQTLGLHSPAISLVGTRQQKAAQLMKMFDEAEAKISREESCRGDRKTLRIEG